MDVKIVSDLCVRRTQKKNVTKSDCVRQYTKTVSPDLVHMRFLGMCTCVLCVSPYRGSVRRDTRAPATLTPRGLA